MSKYAVVISIDQYEHLSDVPSAADNAESIALLLEQCQYQVIRLPKKKKRKSQRAINSDRAPTYIELSAALRHFFNKQARHGDAVLYFSGRCIQVEDALTGETSVHVATSHTTALGQNAIPLNSLQQLINHSELNSLLVLMDICCDGRSRSEQQQLLDSLKSLLNGQKGTCMLASCFNASDRHSERKLAETALAKNKPARRKPVKREPAEHKPIEHKNNRLLADALRQALAAAQIEGTQLTSHQLCSFVTQSLMSTSQIFVQAGAREEIVIADKSQPPAKRKSRPETSANVFISYRSQLPDKQLAEEFYQALQAAGHEVFMAAECIRLGDDWSQRIDYELERCEYFLLLLSSQSATSEMVTEEVRRARELHDTRKTGKPVIMPIRVNFPISSALNYDLGGYLNRIQQREWRSEKDTPKILKEVLTILSGASDSELPLKSKAASKSLAEPLAEPLAESLTEPLIEKPAAPPTPVAPPELPGGQVDLASLYYVERPPIETNCRETVLQPGALIRIKAPRQMGKTSLMSRVLHHAEDNNCLSVPLSFQLADADIFTDLDRCLRWFCASVGRRLKQPSKISEYWDDDLFGSKDNCSAYFEEYLLPSLSVPLVLGLDEVDMVFKHPEIAANFMGLLRAWHEAGKVNALWKKLRLVIVHSTEVYIPMNINQSPFNVGLPIDLSEFSLNQVLELARRHGLDWEKETVMQLMKMVGGHPYLIQVALYQVAQQKMPLSKLLEIAPTEAGPYGDHLRRHWWNLEQRAEMAAAAKRVMATDGPVRLEPIQSFQLHSMGIVHLQGNEVIPRCDLYRQYFSDRLSAGRT